MAKDKPQDQLSVEDHLAAANLELVELRAKQKQAERRNPLNARAALDPKSLEHPHAFMAGDGRTLYEYELDGQKLILPKPMEEMSEQDYYDLSFSVRDNQAGRIPQNLTVVFKDPQWAGHWFNKKAGSGKRVGEARSMGFVPAKIEDLESYFPSLNDKDGALEDNDLVLMKIHKAKLYLTIGALIARAKRDGGVEAYRQRAAVGLAPRDMEHDPYFLTPQATGERQGIGPVTHLPEINR